MSFDDLGLFLAKDSAYLNGVSKNLLRIPAALKRAFDVDEATLANLQRKHKFGGVLITDGQDHGLRKGYDSPHKHGNAIDIALFSVPQVPPIRIGNRTLRDDKAKEQFMADLATYMTIGKFRASIHDVGFGNHAHLEHGDFSSVNGFNPARSVTTTQGLQDAESRLRQVFTHWGMDPNAAFARIKNENGVMASLDAITRGARDMFAGLADRLGVGNLDEKRRNATIADKLAKDAKFTERGGDQRFAKVHDWVKTEKGTKPNSSEIAAYQALLTASNLNPGKIDGKAGPRTKEAAARFEKLFPNQNSVQLAQAVLGSRAESPEAIAAAEAAKAEAAKRQAATPQAPSRPNITVANTPRPPAAAQKPTTTAAAPSEQKPPRPVLHIKIPGSSVAAAPTPGTKPVTGAAKPTTAANTAAKPLDAEKIVSLRRHHHLYAFEFSRMQEAMMGLNPKDSNPFLSNRKKVDTARSYMQSVVGGDFKEIKDDSARDKTLATAFSAHVKKYQQSMPGLPHDGVLGIETFNTAKAAHAANTARKKTLAAGPIRDQPGAHA